MSDDKEDNVFSIFNGADFNNGVTGDQNNLAFIANGVLTLWFDGKGRVHYSCDPSEAARVFIEAINQIAKPFLGYQQGKLDLCESLLTTINDIELDLNKQDIIAMLKARIAMLYMEIHSGT